MSKENQIFEQFTALVRRHEETIKRVSAYFYMPNSYLFREMMTYLTSYLWEVYSQLPPDVVIFNERGWVFTILYRQAAKHARDERRYQSHLVYGADLSGCADNDGADPQVTRLYRLINKLGEEDREIIVMYLDKVPVQQMAAAMGRNAVYVYRHINKIVEILRRLNYDVGDDEDNEPIYNVKNPPIE